jgi:D-3-phosphoglycerate dehydrogenase
MGCDVDVITGKTPEELKAIIGQYDGLAIRSSTKVTKDILEAATNLKVIGRAGIGVDNVDIPAASAQGVVVMNTPFGNSITTAEHAIALMFALARQLPEADLSTQAGKWEEPLHGCRSHRQDSWPDRRGQHRFDRCQPRAGPADEGRCL